MAEQVGPAPLPIYVGGSSSDSEGELVRPPRGEGGQPRPKRRRVLCTTEIPTVPVYSNKVNSSFQLCPAELHQEVPTLRWQGGADLDVVDEIGPVTPPRPERPHAPRLPQGPCTDWLEEEPQQQGAARSVRDESPSPPPPPQPTRRQRGRTRREVARQLRGLNTWLSAAQRSLREEPPEADVILVEPPASRQLQLKVRCRAEIHRVAVEMSQPLQVVVEHMAGRLQVRPEQILLLLRDAELPPGSTPQGLGLGVADIIDCVVDVAAGELQGGGESGAGPGPGELRLTVRGQEKDSQLTLNVPRAEPLHRLMERYQEAMGLSGRQLRFFFDGQRLAGTRTPEQLGMEPDDVIEAWA